MEKPIIFNAEMVRAILDGRKTQTRRILKPAIVEALNFLGGDLSEEDEPGVGILFGKCKGDDGKVGKPQWLAHCAEYPEEGCIEIGAGYGRPGDRLWVREAFQPLWADGVEYASETNYKTGKGYTVSYPATDGVEEFVDADDNISAACRPSIHMPRWASRITLEVTAVRVERLQDITDADAMAEGVPNRSEFMWLWRHIYGPQSWIDNPLVWVIEFKKLDI